MNSAQTIAMIFATPNNIPAFVVQRLTILLALLRERKNEFESFAANVHSRRLRLAILCLSQECNQYAHELEGQLDSITGNLDIYKEQLTIQETLLLRKDDDILPSCEISERKLIRAYRNLLNEPVLDSSLRSLLRNQLQGITCALMQVRLLNSEIAHR